jgi:flagellar motor protein MotB
MNPAGRNRWAVSFADLCLLLLGFFVLLQANSGKQQQALQGLGAYFSRIQAPKQVDLGADILFQPGEALMSEIGRARLASALAPLVRNDASLTIQSFGIAGDASRFDGWDLAAARLGAVARAARAMGVPEQRIKIAGLADEGAETKGQTIRVIATSPAR